MSIFPVPTARAAPFKKCHSHCVGLLFLKVKTLSPHLYGHSQLPRCMARMMMMRSRDTSQENNQKHLNLHNIFLSKGQHVVFQFTSESYESGQLVMHSSQIAQSVDSSCMRKTWKDFGHAKAKKCWTKLSSAEGYRSTRHHLQ